MIIHLPEKVKYIIDILMEAGYEAYAVGGCIRDSILGRTPDDWDITTSAFPSDVKKLFKRTVDTGILHGTITVLLEKEGFEVTTYRIDGEYEDSRHPKEVVFTGNLLEDLKRRDFTINAMAYNEKTGLVDAFEGMLDLEQKVIRCVGNPQERFEEDALRILRAIRFSAQLGYTIEEHTKAAIAQLADTLLKISAERIQIELVKLITSQNPYFLKIAYDTGVTKVILPELDAIMETEQNNPHHKYSVGEHTLHAMEQVEADKVLRLSLLFHDIGKAFTAATDEKGIDHFYGHAAAGEKIAKTVLKRLRFDNSTIYYVSKIVLYHDYRVEPNRKSVRRAVLKIGEDIFPLLFPVKRADILAQSDYEREQKLQRLEELQRLYEEVIKSKECVSLKTLAVTGTDLIESGVKPGKEIGVLLKSLLDIVIENPEYNTKEILLDKVAKLSKQ